MQYTLLFYSLQPNLGDLQWNKCESDVAYAMSITLYEEEPTATGASQNAGDPIADCCAVITTRNMVIMVRTISNFEQLKKSIDWKK